MAEAALGRVGRAGEVRRVLLEQERAHQVVRRARDHDGVLNERRGRGRNRAAGRHDRALKRHHKALLVRVVGDTGKEVHVFRVAHDHVILHIHAAEREVGIRVRQRVLEHNLLARARVERQVELAQHREREILLHAADAADETQREAALLASQRVRSRRSGRRAASDGGAVA